MRKPCRCSLQAVRELLGMMRLMVATYPDMSDDERRAVKKFKRDTLDLYMQQVEARSSWQTVIM